MVIGLSGVQSGLYLYMWLTKLDNCKVGVRFVNNECDYRMNWMTKSCYQLIKTMTKFEKKLDIGYTFSKKKVNLVKCETTVHAHDAYCPLKQAL